MLMQHQPLHRSTRRPRRTGSRHLNTHSSPHAFPTVSRRQGGATRICIKLIIMYTTSPQDCQQGHPAYLPGYADGQLGDQQLSYEPGFEPGYPQEEPIAPPPDPLAGLSVLQREQALGLYRNMLLLPLGVPQQQGASGGRGGDVWQGGRGVAADRDQGSPQQVRIPLEGRDCGSWGMPATGSEAVLGLPHASTQRVSCALCPQAHFPFPPPHNS